MVKRKKTNRVFLGIVALVALGTAVFIWHEAAKPIIEPPLLAVVLPSRMARLKLDFGDGSHREFRGEVPPPTSALEALSYAADAGNLAVEYARGNAGVIVQRVNGKHSGVRGKIWRLYINGHYTEGDPAAHPVHPSDSIEWKYE